MEPAVESAGIVQAPHKPGFNAVPASLIRALGECHCDLYRGVAWSSEPATFFAGDISLSVAQRNELSQGELACLYVRQADSKRLQTIFREKLDSIAEHEDVPLADRYNLVQSIVEPPK